MTYGFFGLCFQASRILIVSASGLCDFVFSQNPLLAIAKSIVATTIILFSDFMVLSPFLLMLVSVFL